MIKYIFGILAFGGKELCLVVTKYPPERADGVSLSAQKTVQ